LIIDYVVVDREKHYTSDGEKILIRPGVTIASNQFEGYGVKELFHPDSPLVHDLHLYCKQLNSSPLTVSLATLPSPMTQIQSKLVQNSCRGLFWTIVDRITARNYIFPSIFSWHFP
jgi:hypothetical protein